MGLFLFQSLTRIAPALFGLRRTLKISIYVCNWTVADGRCILIHVTSLTSWRAEIFDIFNARSFACQLAAYKFKCHNSSLFMAENETMNV